MKEFGAFLTKRHLREPINVFDISFDVFKELSGDIFSVQFVLPNVMDYQLKDHLLKPFQN